MYMYIMSMYLPHGFKIYYNYMYQCIWVYIAQLNNSSNLLLVRGLTLKAARLQLGENNKNTSRTYMYITYSV